MATSAARVSVRTKLQVTAEVVGTGADGTDPSLVFTVQRHGQYSDDVKVLKTYLFNCGEGTQRLAGESGIKLRSLDAMYFTRFNIKSVSGVPGVIFSLGSCGAGMLQLHGPAGLRGFLGAIRSFVRRKYPQIKCVAIAGSDDEKHVDASGDQSIECEEWTEGEERNDQHTMVIPIGLGLEGTAKNQCLLCEKGAPIHVKSESSKGDSNLNGGNAVKSSQIGRRRIEGDEHERCREWLLQFYQTKVPEKVPYVDVVLNRYRGRYDDLKTQLCAKYGKLIDNKTNLESIEDAEASSSSSDSSSESDGSTSDADTINYAEKPLDRRWLLRFYTQHQPDKVLHVDRVLRQFSGREDTLKKMLLEKYGQNNSPSKPTRPLSDNKLRKRRKLDHPSGDSAPAKLPVDEACAEDIGIPDTTATSRSLCYVMQFQYAPYPVVWIIDCQTSQHLDELEMKFTVSHNCCCNAHIPSLVVHFSPPRIQAQPRYKQWTAAVSSLASSPEQLVFDGGALKSVAQGAFSFAFSSSAKVVVRRQLETLSATADTDTLSSQPSQTTPMTSLVKFLQKESWPAESPCQRQFVRRVNGSKREVHIAQGKLRFRLLHGKNLQLGFDYERTGWRQKSDDDVDTEDDKVEPSDKQSDASPSLQSVITQDEQACSSRKLIVLGTGSASPSKLRASSGIYLELSGTNTAAIESMLVDCGEGTYGQLWRQFGAEVPQRIGGLRCIWISHNHADHHCGLVRVLYEYWRFHATRQDDKLARPLVVVAPQSVLSYVGSWLPAFGGDGSTQRVIQLATCSDFNDHHHPLRQQLLLDIGYAVTSIESVSVFHCYDSYGLVLTLQSGKKLVYSGDTKPCNQLVVAGMNADLLIHEATFDDSMEQDALKKKHSTVGQALDIARRMRARQVVLTHFSQRYPSLPPPVDGSVGASSKLAADVLFAFDGFVHPMPF